jgi:hypothetical protein
MLWNPSINICGTASCYHQLMDNADTSHFIVMTAGSIAKLSSSAVICFLAVRNDLKAEI